MSCPIRRAGYWALSQQTHTSAPWLPRTPIPVDAGLAMPRAYRVEVTHPGCREEGESGRMVGDRLVALTAAGLQSHDWRGVDGRNRSRGARGRISVTRLTTAEPRRPVAAGVVDGRCRRLLEPTPSCSFSRCSNCRPWQREPRHLKLAPPAPRWVPVNLTTPKQVTPPRLLHRRAACFTADRSDRRNIQVPTQPPNATRCC
jgi:hypothetical protein